MATNYTGEKCIVCGEPFKDGQDIVVCPDCGTPYHRECWAKHGECINKALHESGESWKPAPVQPLAEGTHRCMRCGSVYTEGQHFCSVCGLPLDNIPGAARPFNGEVPRPEGFPRFDEENGGSDLRGTPMPQIRQIKLTAQSDLDGIKLGDFFDYIGNRSINIITSFVKFAKTSAKTSFNIAAFFFPEFYFFYRRMPKYGILFLLTSFILSIPSLIFYGQTGTLGQVFFTTGINESSAEFRTIVEVCQLISLGTQIVASIFANYWYYCKARQDIAEIRATFGEKEPDHMTQEKIRGAGGTSWAAVVGAFAGEMVLTLAFLLIMSVLF